MPTDMCYVVSYAKKWARIVAAGVYLCCAVIILLIGHRTKRLNFLHRTEISKSGYIYFLFISTMKLLFLHIRTGRVEFGIQYRLLENEQLKVCIHQLGLGFKNNCFIFLSILVDIFKLIHIKYQDDRVVLLLNNFWSAGCINNTSVEIN